MLFSRWRYSTNFWSLVCIASGFILSTFHCQSQMCCQFPHFICLCLCDGWCLAAAHAAVAGITLGALGWPVLPPRPKSWLLMSSWGCRIWKGHRCRQGPESQVLLQLERQGCGLIVLLPNSLWALQWAGGRVGCCYWVFWGCRLSQLGAAGITGTASTVSYFLCVPVHSSSYVQIFRSLWCPSVLGRETFVEYRN